MLSNYKTTLLRERKFNERGEYPLRRLKKKLKNDDMQKKIKTNNKYQMIIKAVINMYLSLML